jgi:hypothetical protein
MEKSARELGANSMIAAQPKDFEARAVGSILNATTGGSPVNKQIQVTPAFEWSNSLRWE